MRDYNVTNVIIKYIARATIPLSEKEFSWISEYDVYGRFNSFSEAEDFIDFIKEKFDDKTLNKNMIQSQLLMKSNFDIDFDGKLRFEILPILTVTS